MYNNLYQQTSLDNLNKQIAELERLRTQMQQPAPITQNFQIAPSAGIRYANSIEEVQKSFVVADTPFFSRDLSVLWVKNTKGEIKSYELNEIVEKDDKDIQISLLQQQINELKGMINNEQPITDVNATEIETDTKRNDEPIRTATKSKKSSSISRVSTSKER